MVGEGYKAPPLFWLRMPPQQGLPLCLCVEARLCPPNAKGVFVVWRGLVGSACATLRRWGCVPQRSRFSFLSSSVRCGLGVCYIAIAVLNVYHISSQLSS